MFRAFSIFLCKRGGNIEDS